MIIVFASTNIFFQWRTAGLRFKGEYKTKQLLGGDVSEKTIDDAIALQAKMDESNGTSANGSFGGASHHNSNGNSGGVCGFDQENGHGGE